jgi:hypothetical protein
MNREDMYKNEIAEMQKMNRCLMVRIKELSEEVDILKRQLGIGCVHEYDHNGECLKCDESVLDECMEIKE